MTGREALRELASLPWAVRTARVHAARVEADRAFYGDEMVTEALDLARTSMLSYDAARDHLARTLWGPS